MHSTMCSNGLQSRVGFMVQAMLATSDSGALLRFVQRPNLVDLAEGESALQGAGRYSELVALYQARDQHEAALDLLRQVSQSPQELPTPPQGPPRLLADCQCSGVRCTPCSVFGASCGPQIAPCLAYARRMQEGTQLSRYVHDLGASCWCRCCGRVGRRDGGLGRSEMPGHSRDGADRLGQAACQVPSVPWLPSPRHSPFAPGTALALPSIRCAAKAL